MMGKEPYKYWYEHPVVYEIRKNIEETIYGSDLYGDLNQDYLSEYMEFPQDILDEFEEVIPPHLRYMSPEGHLLYMGVMLVPEGWLD